MRKAILIISIVVISFTTACNSTATKPKLGKKFLCINFHEGQTLRYRFISQRAIEVDFGPLKSKGKTAGKHSIEKSSESLNMVVSYTPVEVNLYGTTTVKATCESMETSRSRGKRSRSKSPEAARNIIGKSFEFKVLPNGTIEDRSELYTLIRQAGNKAFRAEGKIGRIKEPDMITDFIASQWFLWDSISSIEEPTKGISVGQSWKSKLSIPNPMLLRKARDGLYTLEEIRQTESGELAVINSIFSPSKSYPNGWPMPYSGRFQMSGMFGFLRNYKLLELQGEGEELFNIDKGHTEQYTQQYKMIMKASLFGSMSMGPKITIDQKLSMKLLED